MPTPATGPHSQLEAICQKLASAHRVVLTTHITPDGDGLGSALALCRHLRTQGKVAEVINCSAAPHSLRFLYHRGEISVFQPGRHRERIRSCDVIVATDLGGTSRLGRMEDPVRRSAATRILIDHHLFETEFFELPLVVPQASSSAEITFDLIRHLGGQLTPELAVPLYVGLVTDTGSFSFSGTSSRAHRIAAELVEAGADPHALWHQLSCQVPFAKMRFLGLCLARLNLVHDGQLVWTSVDRQTLARSDVLARDAFEVVNHFLQIKGVEAGAFFMEVSPDRTKVSLRSAGRLDVSGLARSHGGGGHRFAAGCTVEGRNLKATIELVLSELAGLLPRDLPAG